MSKPTASTIIEPKPFELADQGPWFFVYPNPSSPGYGEPLVMDVQGASTTPGTGIIAYTPNLGPTDNQLWWVRPSDEQNYYFIVNRNSGLVLDVPGGATGGGVQLIQWQQQGNDSQKWTLVEGGGSFGPTPRNQKTYYIYNKQAQKVLDVYYEGPGLKQPDNPITCEQQTPPGPTYDQRWYFAVTPDGIPGSGE